MNLNFKEHKELFIVIGFLLVILVIGAANSKDLLQYIPIIGAMRIESGELPYRDFYTNSSPGSMFLLNGIMKSVATSLFSLKIAMALISLTIGLTSYKIANKLFESKQSLYVLIYSTIIASGLTLSEFGLSISLIFLLFSIYYLIENIKQNDKFSIYYSATSAASAIFFNFKLIPYISILAISILYFKSAFLGQKPLRDIGKFIWLYLALIFSFYSSFIFSCGFGNIYSQLVNLTYGRFLSCELGAFEYAYQYLFPLIYLISFSVIILVLWKEKNLTNELKIVSISTIIAIALFLHYSYTFNSRAGIIIPSLIFTLILPIGMRLKNSILKRISIIAYSLLILSYPIYDKVTTSISSSSCAGIAISGSESKTNDYSALANYIDAHSKQENRIMIYPSQNPNLYYSDLIVYYLSNRIPANKFHEQALDMIKDKSKQMNIVQDLRTYNANFIIQRVENSKTPLPILDEFIDLRYEIVHKIGDFQIWGLR
jgi:hypothetical protein